MKKNTVFLTLFIVITCFCSFTKPLDDEKIVARHFAALNAHDLNGLAVDYADSVKLYSASWDGAKTGPAEAKLAYSRYFHTSPDLKYKITSIIYGDHSAVIEYESTGTMVNLEGGSPAYMQGKKYTLKNCTIEHFQDGKIIYESTYFDQVSFLRQMDFFGHQQ